MVGSHGRPLVMIHRVSLRHMIVSHGRQKEDIGVEAEVHVVGVGARTIVPLGVNLATGRVIVIMDR